MPYSNDIHDTAAPQPLKQGKQPSWLQNTHWLATWAPGSLCTVPLTTGTGHCMTSYRDIMHSSNPTQSIAVHTSHEKPTHNNISCGQQQSRQSMHLSACVQDMQERGRQPHGSGPTHRLHLTMPQQQSPAECSGKQPSRHRHHIRALSPQHAGSAGSIDACASSAAFSMGLADHNTRAIQREHKSAAA